MSWITSLIGHLNYGTVLLLMLLESTVIPVPSELVVSPAAYHAAGGHLNVFLVILFATVGADLGASINYVAGYYLGRPIIYKFANSKWGKMCLLNQEKVEKSEKYFNDHGMVATISGRLIPGIRHLISIPAGLAKMSYWKFLLYTTIGAGVWNCILAALGWYLHSVVPEDQLTEKLEEYGDYIKWGILALVGLVVLYFAVRWFVKKRKKANIDIDETEEEQGE
ncbi:MAG: DedA family protein [Prevotella sp.]|nr:DedA family protein [Prevotella sp.]